MKITNLKLSLLSIFLTVLFNLFVLSGFNPFFIGSFYAFIFLLFFPGFFIKRLLGFEKVLFFESITYIVGFSITYLYLVGLGANSLVFLLHNSKPLTSINSLAVFDFSF